MNVAAQTARLISLVRANEPFMCWLRSVRTLGLASWCIGAGAVRNLAWDALTGRDAPSVLADVDVAFFDAADISPDAPVWQRPEDGRCQ